MHYSFLNKKTYLSNPKYSDVISLLIKKTKLYETGYPFGFVFLFPTLKLKEHLGLFRKFRAFNLNYKRLYSPAYYVSTSVFENLLHFYTDFVCSLTNNNRIFLVMTVFREQSCSLTFLKEIARCYLDNNILSLLKILKSNFYVSKLYNANIPSIIKVYKAQENSNK